MLILVLILSVPPYILQENLFLVSSCESLPLCPLALHGPCVAACYTHAIPVSQHAILPQRHSVLLWHIPIDVAGWRWGAPMSQDGDGGSHLRHTVWLHCGRGRSGVESACMPPNTQQC